MLKRVGVTCVAVLLMTAMVQAQPPGQGRGRGGPGGFGGFGRGGFGMGYAQLVGIEEVQKELKVTEDQQATLEKQADERRAAREQGQGGGQRFNFQEFQNLTDEERQARMEQFRKDAAEREKKSREEIATVLDESQMKRLREIWIQVLGVGALSNDEVAAELKITDLQKEEIADTQQDAFREMGEQMQGLFQRGQEQSDEERQAARTKMDQLRKEAEEKVLANLNDEQKKQLETMKGAKFDLPQGAFGFGGGRGRGGRPGGDGDGRRPGGDGGNNNGGGNRPRRPDSV